MDKLERFEALVTALLEAHPWLMIIGAGILAWCLLFIILLHHRHKTDQFRPITSSAPSRTITPADDASLHGSQEPS